MIKLEKDCKKFRHYYKDKRYSQINERQMTGGYAKFVSNRFFNGNNIQKVSSNTI